jgi:hypothetical protein
MRWNLDPIGRARQHSGFELVASDSSYATSNANAMAIVHSDSGPNEDKGTFAIA